MLDLLKINKWLRDIYGITISGHPKFQLSWSENETETRKSTFVKRDDHGNYLGQSTEFRLTRKYSYLKNQYILETFFYNPIPDKVIGDYAYEPLWAFQPGQVPNENALQFLINSFLNPPKPLTPEQLLARKNEKQEKEYRKDLEFLQKDTSFLHMQMKHGEAIVNPWPGKDKRDVNPTK